ncbi:Cystathionine beta-lyase [compost metagenome]
MRGLRTLDVRLARHHENALAVARYLEGQADVARVYYPALEQDPGHALWRRDYSGASGLVSFALRHADPAAASHYLDALQYFSIGASWGGYESLALEAAPDRLAEHGYWREGGQERQSVLRLHVGLESPLDLIEDLERAFGATGDALRRSA